MQMTNSKLLSRFSIIQHPWENNFKSQFIYSSIDRAGFAQYLQIIQQGKWRSDPS